MFKNTKEAERRRKEANQTLLYKNKNLLEFAGRRDDYTSFGRFLSRCTLNREQRIKTCWLAQMSTIEGREMASEEGEKLFRGGYLSGVYVRTNKKHSEQDSLKNCGFRGSKSVLWCQFVCSTPGQRRSKRPQLERA